MVRILRDAARRKTAREILLEDGRRFHLFSDSAEGRHRGWIGRSRPSAQRTRGVASINAEHPLEERSSARDPRGPGARGEAMRAAVRDDQLGLTPA